MSKRSIIKVRHYKPAPTFKERVAAGNNGTFDLLWMKYGFGNQEDSQPQQQEAVEDE